MPLTFQGGQALPAVGSDAYKTAQAAPNANASYNATTGMLIKTPATSTITSGGSSPTPVLLNPPSASGGGSSSTSANSTTPQPPSPAVPLTQTQSPYGQNSNASAANAINANANRASADIGADPFAPGGSFDTDFARETQMSQSKIDAINSSAAAQIQEVNDTKTQRDAALTAGINSSLGAAGLQGSTVATATLNNSLAPGDKADEDTINNITVQRQANVASVLDSIEASANADVVTGENADQNAITAQTNLKATTQDQIKSLASSEVDLQSFKQNFPDQYATLVAGMGGDENLVSANWALSKPQGAVIQAYQQGGNYVQITKDPLTGAVSSQTFALGFTPPPNWTAQKVGTQGLMYYDPTTFNPNDPSTYKYFDATNGYTAANESLTLASKQQSINASTARQVQSILRSTGLLSGSGGSGASGSIPAKFYNATTIVNRINQAASTGANAVSDEDIVDALVSMNTGGGKPSQAQFDQILSSLGVADKAGIKYNNYVNNSSSFLPADIKADAVKLVNSNYTALKGSKDAWDQTATDILSKNGITPDKYDITTDDTFLSPPSTTDTSSSSDGDFNSWISDNGIDTTGMSDDQISQLQSAYDSSQ